MPWKKSGFLIHNSLCLKAGSQMREYANNFIGLYSKSEKRFSVIRTQVASSMKGKSPFYGFFYIGHKRQRSRLTLAPLFDHDTLVIDPAARPWTMMKSFRKSLLKEKNKIIYQMVQKPHKTDDSIKSYMLVNVRGTFLRDSLYSRMLSR